MFKYLMKRFVISILTLFVLITVVWILVRLVPGDKKKKKKVTPQIKLNMIRYYGFDQPLYRQYLIYLRNLLKGDLGYSLKYRNVTVNKILADSFPYSASLGIRSLLFALVGGILLGTTAAFNRGRFLDYFCIIIAIIGVSVPDFILGYLLQFVFGIRLKWLPVAQWQGIKYTILPVIGLGTYTLAMISRLMRTNMLEVLQQDYIKTAKSKGLSTLKIILKHQLRNAIIPVITVLGPTTAAILTGTFVIESIFSIPGMGKYYVTAVQNLDYSLILGMTIFYGFFLVVANAIVDLLYGIIDPRIRIY